MNKLACTILLFACALPLTSGAQTLQSLGGQDGAIQVSTIPERPGPNQLVTVEIVSYATDLDRSDISWFLNNTLAKEAVGGKKFTFKTGGAGSLSNILIVVKTPEGALIQQTLNIRPATVDLIWEAQSYTPPFYKGKALYPYQGTVKVTAIPNIVTENGGALSAKSLVYTWSVNDSVNQDASGYGKNFLFFAGSVPLKPTTIGVEVASVDKAYVATAETTFAPAPPELLFYEDSPLYGILYNKALGGSVVLKNEEIKIAAIPYFIGAKGRAGTGLTYNWQLNNEAVGSGAGNESLTFRQSKGMAGTSLISLQVANPAKIFQFVTNNLSLTFGTREPANGF